MKASTILILGPTAGGKTALALDLAQRLGGAECVSADSMLVYTGMDIGTAKPTADERARVPHHMIDVADPHSDAFTLADWLDGAQRAMADIHARGKHALVVGGTNLYVKALLEGMFAGPAPDEALRRELEALPSEMLRTQLESCDPVAAARIHANDRRRTIRAIEVHRQTGTPISALQEQWRARPDALPNGWHIVGLEWPVDAINRRINARVEKMFECGLVQEVAGLLAKGPLTRQAVEAVGYDEAVQHLAGQMSLEEAVEHTKVRTRRLGKQQRTWLRRFRLVPHSLWIEGAETPIEAASGAVIKKILG